MTAILCGATPSSAIALCSEFRKAWSPHPLSLIHISGNHWSARTIEFFDYTDWNDNLVTGRTWLPYRRNTYRGHLLFAHDVVTRQGFFFLKEAPSSSTQLHYPGSDFVADFSDFRCV